MAVHVDINPEFNDRSVMVSANDLKRNLERTGNESAEAWARGFERAGPRVQKAYETAYKGASNAASTLRAEEAKLSDVRNKAEREAEALAAQETKVANVRKNLPNLTATIAAEEEKLKELRDRHNSTLAELTVRTESATRAFTNQNSAMTDLGRAFKAAESGAQSLSDSSSEMTTSIGRFGPVAVVAIGGAASALSGLVGVAASASQALIALPAVVGAAGAAFGTLQLATLGFDDALKAIGDPKKFGEAIKGLAPNAQQAALAIQALMPEFQQLKNATQNAFFSNAAPQLNALTTELLPMVQQTTTGIATAFNAAFAGVANQLQTPETKAALDTFGQNITKAFGALAPATAPLTKALGDLLSVGSGALPQIAVAATNAATAFSAFIDKAAQSGELKSALDAGLNTLVQLVPVAEHFGQAFLSLAPLGEKVLPSVVSALDQTAAVLPDIITLASNGGSAFKLWSDTLKDVGPLLKVINGGLELINGEIPGIHQSLTDLLNPLHIMAEIIKGIEWFFNPGGRDNAMRDRAQQLLDDKRAQMGLPPSSASTTPGIPLPATATYGGLGTSALLPPASGPSWSGDGNPFGTKPSASSGGPKLPTAPVTPYDSSLPAGFAGLPQTAAMLSAESSYMDANTSLAEKKARANQLEKSNVATADEIQKARNDVISAEHTQQEAEMRLYDARQQMFDKSNKQLGDAASQMGEIGVKLDQDLGISKGLAGIADNLVRFVGSLALAPWEAKMQAITNAPGQAQGGFGLMGILGAQGAFGPQYTAAGQAAANASGAAAGSTGGYYPGASAGGEYGLPAGTNTGGYGSGGKGIFPDWVQQIGAVFGVTPSTYAGHQETDRHEAGYAPNPMHENRGIDWTGTPEAMQRFADYLKNVPGMEQVIWNGGGVGTGDTVEIAGGRSQPGYFAGDLAGHGGHVHTRQSTPIPLPGGATTADYAPAPTPYDSAAAPTTVVAGAMPASSALSGLPIPLPVTIVGGGGGFGGGSPFGIPGSPGGAAPGTPASGQGFGPAPGPVDAGVPSPTPGGSLGWGSPLPTLPAGGGGGQGFGPGASSPGFLSQGTGPGAAPGTQIGAAVAPAGGTGKGGVGASDSTMALAGMAASALDVVAPGAGQVAQIGMKLANRAVQYGGQVAGIGVQGLMQTVLPTGGSELANNSWATKLIGGLAGAAPALPNMAGKPAAPPAQGQGQPGQAAPGGDTHITNNVTNQRATEDGTGKDIAWNMQNMYQPAGKP